MKKTTFSAAISLILCVASCSSDDPTMSNLSMESNVPTTKNTRGSEETPILHFTDMLEFNNALYRGVAQALTYNWIMGGAYAKTPYSANHATIVPCIEQGVNN